MLKYRPYQIEAQAAVRDAWALRLPGDPWPMVVCCTGAGKTELALRLVLEAVERGERVVWLAHTNELVLEPRDRFRRYFPEHAAKAGVVQAGTNECRRQVVFASVQTLMVARRIDQLLAAGPVDLLVCDEAHHSTSPGQTRVISRLLAAADDHAGGHALGLTATPFREDGRDLGERWEIVYSYEIMDAISEGFLVSPYASVRKLPKLDLSKVSGRRDYDDAELGRALMLQGIVDHTVAALEGLHTATRLPIETGAETRQIQARGRAILVYTATVEQAEATATALCAAGWNARAVSGATPRDMRDKMIRAFKAGHIEILCNAALLTEGTDMPIASVEVICRPTRSESLFIQMIGRVLRLHCSAFERTDPRMNALNPEYLDAGGKPDALVIDLVGATEEHSLISSAVLLGASRCPKSPTGAHEWAEAKDGRGKCPHCEAKCACFVSALRGGSGVHEWDPRGWCKNCDRPQCSQSPDAQTGRDAGGQPRHAWIPIPDAEKPRRACLFCEVEISDSLVAMYDRTAPQKAETAPAAWLTLRGLVPRTFAVDLDHHGALFVVECESGLFQPYWLRNRARKPRPITRGPVTNERVRWLVDDLVRRAEKVNDLYGGKARERDYLLARSKLAYRAVELGLAKHAADHNSNTPSSLTVSGATSTASPANAQRHAPHALRSVR